jgi:hypothetical protein
VSLKTILRIYIDAAAKYYLFLIYGVSLYSLDPYESDCKFNMNVIHRFLDHVFNIIEDHDLDLYSYIFKCIAFLIQKPGSKTETGSVIIGEQATVKNEFSTDSISKLFGSYAISYENNISYFIRPFHSSIEIKILIVCNEPQRIDNAKNLSTD